MHTVICLMQGDFIDIKHRLECESWKVSWTHKFTMLVSGVLGPKSRSWFPWVLGSGVSGLGFWFTGPLVLSSRPRVTGSGVLCPGSWGPRSRVRGPHLRLWPSSIETIFQKKKTSFVVVYINIQVWILVISMKNFSYH